MGYFFLDVKSNPFNTWGVEKYLFIAAGVSFPSCGYLYTFLLVFLEEENIVVANYLLQLKTGSVLGGAYKMSSREEEQEIFLCRFITGL